MSSNVTIAEVRRSRRPAARGSGPRARGGLARGCFDHCVLGETAVWARRRLAGAGLRAGVQRFAVHDGASAFEPPSQQHALPLLAHLAPNRCVTHRPLR